MKKITIQILILLVLCFSIGSINLMKARATGETAFGGMYTFTLDESTCNCSNTNVHFIMDYTNNKVLKLYSSPASRFYSNNNSEATYQLGTYTSGGPSCMMIVGEDCVQVSTVDGTYGTSIGTGTSMKTKLKDMFTPVIKFAQKSLLGRV